MTFSGELAIWIVSCLIGSVVSALALRLAHLILEDVRGSSNDPDVIDGTKHLKRMQIERLVGWLFLLGIGLAAQLQPAPAAPIGTTPIGQLIRWTLIGWVTLQAWETTHDYLFTRRMWRRRH